MAPPPAPAPAHAAPSIDSDLLARATLRAPGGGPAALPRGAVGNPDATVGLYFSAHW